MSNIFLIFKKVGVVLDTNCLASLNPKWLFWLQKGRGTTLKPGQECGAVFPPFLCHRANASALVWSVESRSPCVSPRLMTQSHPYALRCCLNFAEPPAPPEVTLVFKSADSHTGIAILLEPTVLPQLRGCASSVRVPLSLPLPPRPLPCARSLFPFS